MNIIITDGEIIVIKSADDFCVEAPKNILRFDDIFDLIKDKL